MRQQTGDAEQRDHDQQTGDDQANRTVAVPPDAADEASVANGRWRGGGGRIGDDRKDAHARPRNAPGAHEARRHRVI